MSKILFMNLWYCTLHSRVYIFISIVYVIGFIRYAFKKKNYQQRILKSFKYKDIYNAFYHTLNNPLTLSHISLIVVKNWSCKKKLILKGTTQKYLVKFVWIMPKVGISHGWLSSLRLLQLIFCVLFL